jgi:Domain of unknown function (DUF222)
MFEYAPPLTEVDVLTSPDPVAAELATTQPRADDMAALLLLDPDAVSDAGRIDLLVAFERHIALLQAAQQQVLASLDGRALDWSGKKLIDYTREQVGAALRLSPGTAERRLAVARTLADRLPATLELLGAGQITYLHAMKLAEAVTPFDDQTTAKIEDRVLARAAEQTLSQFAASLRRAVIAADPRRGEQRHEDAVTARRVVFTPQDDGITELWALLPAEGAALIEAVLNSLASGQTDARSADQRRADALVDVFTRVLADPNLPEAHGQRPAINVTVSISTLLGCDNQPAHLDGYGPITAALSPAYRHRSDRHLAAAGHRPHRPTPRPRPPHLPATSQPHPPHHRPRPNLHLPRLPTTSQTLRPRPPSAIRQRRRDHHRQHHRPMPTPPQRQTPRRLARHPTTRRHTRMDQPHRSHLRQAT